MLIRVHKQAGFWKELCRTSGVVVIPQRIVNTDHIKEIVDDKHSEGCILHFIDGKKLKVGNPIQEILDQQSIRVKFDPQELRIIHKVVEEPKSAGNDNPNPPARKTRAASR